MDIGKMRHRITIQEPTESTDSEGNLTETWSDVATIWAEWQPHELRRSAEKFSAEQWQGKRTGQFVCRIYDGITPSMRVNWTDESRIFDIQAVNIDNHKRQITILVLERV